MHTQTKADLFRSIPKVDRLLESGEIQDLMRLYSRQQVLEGVRDVLGELRRGIGEGTLSTHDLEIGAIRERVSRHLALKSRPYYRRVINATGVVLHTGIGRAVLAPQAVAALTEVAGSPQRLEIDLESGQRGGRDEGCAALVRRLTGCEAATVVNNNAAATILILAALARGKKVILSRGEMVEIGGSFRIPEVMEESGAVLVDVGTTNRTHLRDYRDAIDSETGMILKVHTSNYRVLGFTSEVEIEELVALGRDHGIPVVHDLGSGCLVDLAQRGVPGESLVQHSLAAGADLVCFSGDKLLGGPQAGILAGSKEAVDRCRRHPLMRAFRPGRLVYTALEATLKLYLDGEEAAIERIPTLRRLLSDPAELRQRARRLARRLGAIPGVKAAVVACSSQAGSGSLPTRELPSWGVQVVPANGCPESIAASLRTGEPSILARLRDEALLFDVRSLEDSELPLIAQALAKLVAA